MSAIAAPTRSAEPERKVRVVGTPASKTPDQAVQWRKDLVEALLCAAGTDESICYSGESERLLRAAHYLADAMSRRPEEFYDSGEATTVNETYTIASLIKAALQVPGDAPSPERLSFIEQARMPLVALTNDPGVLDGWETYPAAVARRRAAPPVETPSADGASVLPSDVHDSLSCRFARAAAVLHTLVHVFGGDAGIDESDKCPGLHGTLKHAQWLLSGLHLEIMRLTQQLPDDLRSRTFEASQLVDLLEHLEFAHGFTFGKWSEGRVCMYFDVALNCVRTAQAALTTVKVV
ncbi:MULTISPECIES: hypothetical protein [unclassified Acidovorax]|uniref:hypothetical protein n=1 Tax=unclassified Acidovorax TaxID=2684926 RepID=UPI002882EE8C|nr:MULTISPECIES: hypothetical protein [unclassified Acidovorax]